LAKVDYANRGYQIKNMRVGADFLAIKWGERPTLVEAKYCSGRLSPAQRKKKAWAKKNGYDYDEYRCACRLIA
jgi:hypothetical protein